MFWFKSNAAAIANKVAKGNVIKAKVNVTFSDAVNIGSLAISMKLDSPENFGALIPSNLVKLRKRLARIGPKRKNRNPIIQGLKKKNAFLFIKTCATNPSAKIQ